MKETFLSLFLALLPIIASADDSGTCGDNLTWSYVETTKTLTIKGTGNMQNYTGHHNYSGYYSDAPWDGYRNDIQSVIIESGVSSIGVYAFYYYSNLASVIVPISVTSIGDGAFCGCSELASIIIPNSVTTIGYSAFYGCSKLSFITIPNSVITIGSQAFYNCSGLSSVTIPNSVKTIGGSAFEGCRLFSVVIGSGVTSIGTFAFTKTYLKKTIWLTNTPPSGYDYAAGTVNYVSNDQFSLSNKVKYQSLSSYFDVDGIRYVPVSPSERTCDAIDCVYDESAADTKISSTVKYKGIDMTVKKINSYLAYGNKYIETLSIDTEGTVADNAFASCSNLKSVMISDKVTSIGTYSFSDCSSLMSVKTTEKTLLSKVLQVSKYITSIGNYAFNGCKEIKNVIIADSETELSLGSNGNNPIFSSFPLDSVYIGRNISYKTTQSYGYSPFYRNTSLRAVKITDRETEISENEFYGCTNLQRVIIGEGVTSIGKWAFSGCSSLKYFAFGSQVQNIGQEAFSDCSAVVEVTSKVAEPPVCGSQALEDINKWECKLYVPDGCLAAYGDADQWKDFFFKEEGQGTSSEAGGGGGQANKKCATPTISFINGKIQLSCETDGVDYVTDIRSKDAKTYYDAQISLSNIVIVSVYASKDGYDDSDVATKEIDIAGIFGDLNKDGKVDVADHVELSKIIMGK